MFFALPSSQKHLQAKINKNPRIGIFSLLDYENESESGNLWDLTFFRNGGLLLWLVLAQHDRYESKCEIKSGEIYLPFYYESESKINPKGAQTVKCKP